jgi:hypothetical protein
MLICVDCHRTNAPWAKKCAACGQNLHSIAPNTLISGSPDDALDGNTVENVADSDTQAEIKAWEPDTEWHSMDEIDGEKILDKYTVEPISVIEPSRTSEINWGEARNESEKFDSTPIQVDSKNRFDDYGYDFEKAAGSQWRTTGVLLAGVVGIAIMGALAIGYLHSTTTSLISAKNPTPLGEKSVRSDQPLRSAASADLPRQPASSAGGAMIEEVISVADPIRTQPESVKAETKKTVNPPVFVMSASEPITANPLEGKIAASQKPPDTIATPVKQIAAATAQKQRSITSNKTSPKTTSSLGVMDVPPRVAGTGNESGDSGTGGSVELSPMSAASPAPVQMMAARLKDRQANECAGSAFLGKVVCEERSRVRFCKDRWNDHPDCQLHNNRVDP